MDPITDSTCGTVDLGGQRTIRRLGYGAMRLTGEGVWGPPSDTENARTVLRRAVDLGVEFIDTADAYGPHSNEELIADALFPYPDHLVVSTKAGLVRPGPGQWSPMGAPSHLRAACEASLRRLRVDCIDLLQLHRVDPAVPFAESVGALAELRAEGKVAMVGLSNVDLPQLRVAQEITPIASVQNRYNVREREHEDVLAACEADGIAFLPYYPLGGFGFGSGTRALDEIAARHSTTPAAVAIAWLLRRSPIMVPIPGTASVDHLEQNIGAASLRLDDDEVERLDAFRPEISSILGNKLAKPLSPEARGRIREAAGPIRRVWERLRFWD